MGMAGMEHESKLDAEVGRTEAEDRLWLTGRRWHEPETKRRIRVDAGACRTCYA